MTGVAKSAQCRVAVASVGLAVAVLALALLRPTLAPAVTGQKPKPGCWAARVTKPTRVVAPVTSFPPQRSCWISVAGRTDPGIICTPLTSPISRGVVRYLDSWRRCASRPRRPAWHRSRCTTGRAARPVSRFTWPAAGGRYWRVGGARERYATTAIASPSSADPRGDRSRAHTRGRSPSRKSPSAGRPRPRPLGGHRAALGRLQREPRTSPDRPVRSATRRPTKCLLSGSFRPDARRSRSWFRKSLPKPDRPAAGPRQQKP